MCDGERLWEGKIQPGHEAVGRDHHCNTGYGKQSSVSFLKLTVDSPSLHPSGFMLILDLQIKTNNKIIYKFYKKEVSNNLVILNKLAMPKKVKRITCIEVLWLKGLVQPGEVEAIIAVGELVILLILI